MAILFDDINRLITIESPATEVTCQNLLNAIRTFEYSTGGIDDAQIGFAAGKEALGGDVFVGITLTLRDWKVKFEDRAGPTWIYCNVSGGNLVSVDGNGDFQFPLEPATYVMATITASSSATLQELSAIQYASFNGGVTIDVVNGYAGTGTNTDGDIIGTPKAPSDNTDDALTIADDRGFTQFYIVGNITLNSGTDFDEMLFVGESPTKTTITIDTNADVANCEFFETHVIGVLDGGNVLERCLITNLSYVNGLIKNCVLGSGTITLGGGSDAHFLDCWSGVVGLGTPIIDMGSSGQGLGIRNYAGGIKIINKSGSEDISIDMSSGQVLLDSTITDGTIVVRGIGHLTNNTTGTAVVESHDLLNQDTISVAVWNSLLTDHEVANTFGLIVSDMIKLTGHKVTKSGDIITIYEANGSTIWRQYNLASGGRVEV